MIIEVTEKDLENIMGFIKVFGTCHFKDLSGQQCLAHIRLLEGLIDLGNRIIKVKEAPGVDPLPIIEKKKKK